MSKKSMISISVEEYAALIAIAEKLHALEAAGVDNWDGYEYAMAELDDKETK